MTLDEIMQIAWEDFPLEGNEADFKKTVKVAMLEYARSIVPEEVKPTYDIISEVRVGIAIGFNDCRIQMLSRIEEDSK